MDEKQRSSLEVLTRIISLEARLAGTIEKLDNLVDAVEERYSTILRLYSGDQNTPSVLSRILILENFNKTFRYSLGAVYTAIVGLIISKVIEKS